MHHFSHFEVLLNPLGFLCLLLKGTATLTRRREDWAVLAVTVLLPPALPFLRSCLLQFKGQCINSIVAGHIYHFLVLKPVDLRHVTHVQMKRTLADLHLNMTSAAISLSDHDKV